MLLRNVWIASVALVGLWASSSWAADLQQGFEAKIDELLPGMAAEQIVDRQEPQLAFEAICFEAAAPGKDAEREALCKAILARSGPQTALAARVWLLRKLETIGGEESVDGLRDLLTDSDAQIRESARRALMNNASPLAGDVLREALATAKEGAWRVALIEALGFRKEVSAIEPLAALTSDGDAAVARAAITALARIPYAASAAVIIDLENVRPELLDAQIDAKLRAAEWLTAQGDMDRGASTYESLWATTMPEAVRIAALQGLSRARGASQIPMLVELLTGPDPRWQIVAEQCLREMPDPAATKIMIQLAQLSESQTHVALLGVVALRGDKIALPALTSAVDKFDEAVNVAALKAMGAIGDRTVVGLLATKAVHGSREEKQAARGALAAIADRDVDDEILSMLKEPAAASASEQEQKDRLAMQTVLLDALTQRRTLAAVPVLFDLAADKDAGLADAAIKALGVLAGDKDVPRLVQLLKDNQDAKRMAAAEEATIAVCLRSEEKAGLAEPITAGLNATSAPAQAALIRILGRIEGKKALATVREQCQAKDPTVRNAAILALTAWTDPTAMDALMEVAKTAEDHGRRESALLQGIRLAAKAGEQAPQATFEYLKKAASVAEQPGIREKAVASMSYAGCVDALSYLSPLLDDADLKAVALSAVADVAIAVMGQEGEAAKTALSRVRKETDDDKLRGRIDQALDLLNRYVIAWQWSGPYREKGKNCNALFDIPFGPEKGDGKAVWQPLPVKVEPKPGVFALGGWPPPGDCCAYVRTTIVSDKAQSAVLGLGSDDGAKVWLNDEVVHANNANRGCICGDDKVTLHLKQGSNSLLLKITQGGGEWSFCCTLTATDGSPLQGVTFQAK